MIYKLAEYISAKASLRT